MQAAHQLIAERHVLPAEGIRITAHLHLRAFDGCRGVTCPRMEQNLVSESPFTGCQDAMFAFEQHAALGDLNLRRFPKNLIDRITEIQLLSHRDFEWVFDEGRHPDFLSRGFGCQNNILLLRPAARSRDFDRQGRHAAYLCLLHLGRCCKAPRSVTDHSDAETPADRGIQAADVAVADHDSFMLRRDEPDVGISRPELLRFTQGHRCKWMGFHSNSSLSPRKGWSNTSVVARAQKPVPLEKLKLRIFSAGAV